MSTYTIILLDDEQAKYVRQILQDRIDFLVGEIVDDNDDAEVLAGYHKELQELRSIRL